MGQFWRDPRLGFGLNKTIILSGDATNKLWLPDTFIINSIDTKIHQLVAVNKKAWVHLGNGTIMLVLRYVRLKYDRHNEGKKEGRRERTTE